MDVILIRHTSVDVAPGTCYGQSDVPLRSSFEEEAAATREALQRYAPFDAVFTSPLSRCTRLAGYCGYGNAKRDRRILEINFGDWEMQRFDDISDRRLQEWYDDYLNTAATHGESFHMQYERVADFLNELKASALRRVAVFAHGGVLLCAQIYARAVKPEEAFNALTPYGGIIKICI